MEHDRSPEERLAFALLWQALKDAQHEIVVDEYGRRSPRVTYLSLPDIENAKEFLTATSGEWARSREYWATVAGIDPDYLHRKSISALFSGTSAPESV